MRCSIFFTAIAAAMALAQTPAAPSFEVATIHPYVFRGPRGNDITPGGVNMRGVRLLEFISWAYSVQENQISGPDWLNNTLFDISAKAATPATDPEMRLMMQTLLAERFKLTVHRDQRDMSALVMTLGKNGHKLVENETPGSPSFSTGKMSLTGNGATIKQMTDFISRELKISIVDRTGLTGHYNYHLDIASFVTEEMMRNSNGGVPIEGPGIVAKAMQEQLGFKVDSAKVPMEVIVIDHMEKEPTEN
jgi:uncharacterized protein (TIGR03435 family)